MSDDTLDYFTPSAKQVLIFARQEALHFHHDFVGTEHILLGILKASRGVALNVLMRMEVDLEIAHKKVEELVGPGLDNTAANQFPFTPRYESVRACGQRGQSPRPLLYSILAPSTSCLRCSVRKLLWPCVCSKA